MELTSAVSLDYPSGTVRLVNFPRESRSTRIGLRQSSYRFHPVKVTCINNSIEALTHLVAHISLCWWILRNTARQNGEICKLFAHSGRLELYFSLSCDSQKRAVWAVLIVAWCNLAHFVAGIPFITPGKKQSASTLKPFSLDDFLNKTITFRGFSGSWISGMCSREVRQT